MPVNTNKHYSHQFLKGVYTVCISSNKFKENIQNSAREVVDQTPIPTTIIYFDTIDPVLLEFHCFNSNVRAIYHFISKKKRKSFLIIMKK